MAEAARPRGRCGRSEFMEEAGTKRRPNWVSWSQTGSYKAGTLIDGPLEQIKGSEWAATRR